MKPPRAARLGPAVLCAALALVAVALGACGGPGTPREDASRRLWRGPTETVFSEGVTVYDRRETAQKVSFPTCISVGATSYRFEVVRPVSGSQVVPAGLFESGYSLDRWRLLIPSGQVEDQPRLFVVVLGSTGIVAEYPRLPENRICTASR